MERIGEVKEQQLGFSDWEHSPVRKQNRKEKFLCEMEAVPVLNSGEGDVAFLPAGGRPPYGLETMLRIHLMQNWWSLSDDAMEDALIDNGASAASPGLILRKITPRMPPLSMLPPPQRMRRGTGNHRCTKPVKGTSGSWHEGADWGGQGFRLDPLYGHHGGSCQ